jgi:hypothetical protein
MQAMKLIITSCLMAVFACTAVRGESPTVVTLGGKRFAFKAESILHYSGSYEGIIQRGTLARDTAANIHGARFVFAKDAEIEFYLSGRIAIGHLSRDTLCSVGDRNYIFRKGSRIDFFESGKVSKAYLARDHDLAVGGRRFRFRRGDEEIHDIAFYKSGKIRKAFLSGKSTVRIGANALTMFERIGFDERGAIEWGHLKSDCAVRAGKQTILCAGGEYHQISFHTNGGVEECVLTGPQTVRAGGVALKLESRILFSADGKILRGTLGEETMFRNVKHSRYDTVTFRYDRRGKLAGMDRFEHPHR